MALRSCIAVLLALVVAVPVAADATLGVGPSLGIVLPSDDVGTTVMFGAHGVIHNLIASQPNIVFAPFLSYWSSSFDTGGSGDDPSFSEFGVNFDARYMFPSEGSVDFFAGAGLGLFFSSVDVPEVMTTFGTFGGGSASDTDFGFTFLGGATTAVSPTIDVNGQLRFKLDGVDTIQILGGATYNFTK